ncbi:hypothetical protein OAN61_00055 [bacterium]|nr:hypothetical protein [bacterium]MDC0510777.1 hypothetical protein [bacterium]
MSRAVQSAVSKLRRSPYLTRDLWTGSARRHRWQWTVAAAPSPPEILLLAAR